jgi:hypothetical protein
MDYQPTLERIMHNSASSGRNASRILILYIEKVMFIGDFCIRMGKLRFVSSFFNNAVIDINFAMREGSHIYESLLKNNPYLGKITTGGLDAIAFTEYDIIFCVTYNEEGLLEFIHKRYISDVLSGVFNMTFFSISAMMLVPKSGCRYIFPANHSLYSYAGSHPGELYISREEVKWGNQWLRSMGMRKGELLAILLDSSARKEKVIDTDVYFDYLAYLLSQENIRVLNIDENGVGKEAFYREWLGDEKANKIIFSKKLSIREVLCLIASDHTSLVFGPCTGLMHCASGIYNSRMHGGDGSENIPLMITYTGEYAPGDNAYNWWKNSPLVNCLLLRRDGGSVRLLELGSMDDEEKDSVIPLPCSEYSADMLIAYTAEKWTVCQQS